MHEHVSHYIENMEENFSCRTTFPTIRWAKNRKAFVKNISSSYQKADKKA